MSKKSKIKELTKEELKKLSKVLSELENEAYNSMGYRRINGSFADAKHFNVDNEIIDVELKHGVQDDTEDTVHTEQYQVDRKTMTIIE